MIDFIEHLVFEKETAGLKRRFPAIDSALESFRMICQVHFNPDEPRQVIAPGKLHRITQLDLYSIWKFELPVPGLRSNQFPRIWFAVRGSQVAFLCIRTHIDNYDTNEIDRIARELVTDIF